MPNGKAAIHCRDWKLELGSLLSHLQGFSHYPKPNELLFPSRGDGGFNVFACRLQ
jgi:hypothetical protein